MIAHKIRILIILPRQLGDVLLGTPLAEVLKQHFPYAQVDWWAHPMAKQLLDGNPNINKIFYYPIWKKNKDLNNQFYKILWQRILFIFCSVAFVLKVRKQNYDVVIDAMNNPRTAIQTYLTGAKKRISFSTNFIRNLAYSHVLSRDQFNEGYLGHSRLNLLKPLGIPFDINKYLYIYPLLPISPENKAFVKNWIYEIQKSIHYVSNKNDVIPYFVFSPTHRHFVRRWPGNYFVDLGLKLIEEKGFFVIWLWGPSEDELVYSLHESLQKKLIEKGHDSHFSIFPPLFSLREAGALSQMAKAWVGNSNGLSHVAVAAGANTLELHGPTPQKSWCHPNHNKHRSLQRTIGCTNCSSNICKLARRECLEDLTVNDVFNELKFFF